MGCQDTGTKIKQPKKINCFPGNSTIEEASDEISFPETHFQEEDDLNDFNDQPAYYQAVTQMKGSASASVDLASLIRVSSWKARRSAKKKSFRVHRDSKLCHSRKGAVIYC